MEPHRGFWATLLQFLRFLPFFLGLLLLGIIKGILFCPLICLITTIGNSAVILGLWPAHAIWTYYCISRTKQLGPVLKFLLFIGTFFLLVLWPVVGILGSVLFGAGYGSFAPLLATFEAVGEGKTDELIHCFVDGTWRTVKESFSVVRDVKDVCLHSYFSIMGDFRLRDPPNGKPYEIKLLCIPGSFLLGVLGIMVDVPMITAIAICKSPYMLFKGWNQLFHDLIGREGPFLETACVPFAGLAIILWPAAVAGAVMASSLSSYVLGIYAAVIGYQESSFRMGLRYIPSSLSMFDEYSNDVLDLPEGSCFPRYRYRKEESLHTSSFSRHTSFHQDAKDAVKPPSRTVSFKNVILDMNPFKLIERMFKECKRYGDILVADGVIRGEDIDASRSSKSGNVLLIGLPAYCILKALLRSAKANSDGLLLSDNTEMTSMNRPKDTFFDYFFDPLMIIKEQIRAKNFSEEEEILLSTLVLLMGDSQQPKNLNVGSSSLNECRRAEMEGFARRLQGITKSMSRFPTFRRHYDELVKSLSEELERKMGGSQSANGSRSIRRIRSGFARLFSQKSFGSTSTQGVNQEMLEPSKETLV